MGHTAPANHANCDQSTHLERCQRVCFIEKKMPVIPTFPESTLPWPRAETLPNLWSVCDSPLGANDGQSKDVSLMTIAMPDAFSLSRNEIAARLRLAAPCTYED